MNSNMNSPHPKRFAKVILATKMLWKQKLPGQLKWL
jgi:hypothetical protein